MPDTMKCKKNTENYLLNSKTKYNLKFILACILGIYVNNIELFY